jgi:hypothetical protein
MMMEKLVECLAKETEVLGENMPQYRFVHYKPHMRPGRETGPPRWEASDCQLELRHGLGKIIDYENQLPIPEPENNDKTY